MNPCKCGYYGSRNGKCTCKPSDVKSYLSRISGPMLDRIDIQVEVQSLTYDQMESNRPAESSADIRARVEKARQLQRERYAADPAGIRINAQLSARNINHHCRTTDEAQQLLLMSCETLKLSNRAYTRILKVARTIADLEGSEDILPEHISEAVQYRTLDRKYWG